MSSVQVRPPAPGDGREMARIWLARAWFYAELDPELSHVPYEDGLMEAFETSIRTRREPEDLQLVAEGEEGLVGVVEGHLIQPEENGEAAPVQDAEEPHVMIDSLMVDPTSGRQGIGTKLVEAVEAWTREHGATLAHIDTVGDGPVSVP